MLHLVGHTNLQNLYIIILIEIVVLLYLWYSLGCWMVVEWC